MTIIELVTDLKTHLDAGAKTDSQKLAIYAKLAAVQEYISADGVVPIECFEILGEEGRQCALGGFLVVMAGALDLKGR